MIQALDLYPNISPKVELFIHPSIGFEGHGTAKDIFHHGAQWIAEQLGVIDVC